jgi:3-methylfumaryl-CoA hydratase
MRADTVLLFRYSALTFNGHRIQYDLDYAKQQEYYPGLVVHGPLQATLLIGFAETILGRPLTRFSFRGLNPLFDFQQFTLGAVEQEGSLKLWIVNEDGVQTMDANTE